MNQAIDLVVNEEKPERVVLNSHHKKDFYYLGRSSPLKAPINDVNKGVELDGEGYFQPLAENTADFLNKEISLPLVDQKGGRSVSPVWWRSL